MHQIQSKEMVAEISSQEEDTSLRSLHNDPRVDLRSEWKGSVLDRLRQHCQDQREAICSASVKQQLSYRDVEAASNSIAEQIICQSTDHSGVISIYGDRSPRLTVALLAVIKAGFIFHIIDPKYPTKRIIDCLRYVRPKGFLNASNDPDIPEQISEFIRSDSSLFNISVSRSAESVFPGVRGRQNFIEDASSSQADFPMYVSFTSGTMGSPKAIWGSHGPVSHFFDWQCHEFGIGVSDRVSVLSGLAHDPLLRDVLMPVWAGASSWFPGDEVYTEPGALYRWLRDAKITVIHLTPTLCHLLLNIPRSEASPCLSDLRIAFFGGEALDPGLVKRFQSIAPGAQIVNCYGTTETPQVMAFHTVARGDLSLAASDRKAMATVPIGRGIEGVQVLLVDENGRICREGTIGEICVRTPYRAMRIENISGQPLQAFIQNPYSSNPDDVLYRTGDYGTYLPNGAVVFKGRRDRQVKVRGFRIELAEIESAMQRCHGVSQFWVDTIAKEENDCIVLFVVPAADGALCASDLRNQLSQLLPAFMVPDKIFIRSSLPKTSNGKIDRDQLRQIVDSFPEWAPAPSSDLYKDDGSGLGAILETLRSLSLATGENQEALDPMDSLRTVEVSCMLENEFAVRLPVADLRSCASLSALANTVALFLKKAASAETKAFEADSPATKDLRDLNMESVSSSKNDRATVFDWLPRNERVWKAFANRILQIVARVAPDFLRVRLHKWRGVAIGLNASIGYDTIIETAFPWLVRIGDHVNIGMRVTIIGHFRGIEQSVHRGPTVIIDDYAFVGPGVIILPNVTIGKGAVVAAGSVVSASIPPYCLAQGNPAKVIARCGLPLSGSTTYAEFLDRLVPVASGRETQN